MTVTTAEEQQTNAEIRLEKARKVALERAAAMNEYSTEAEHRRTKSAKLKALRLAKEAEELANAEPVAPKKKPAAKTTRKAKTA